MVAEINSKLKQEGEVVFLPGVHEQGSLPATAVVRAAEGAFSSRLFSVNMHLTVRNSGVLSLIELSTYKFCYKLNG